MAKSPTKTTTTPAPAPAPAQPWSPPAPVASDGGDRATTTDPVPTATPAPEAESAQAAAGGNGGGTDNAPAAESAPTPSTAGGETVATTTDAIPSTPAAEIPGVDSDDVDVEGTHEQAERLAENDVAKTPPQSELPSFVRDQISPSGIDIALEADRNDKPDLERSAYPSLGERLYAMLGRASDDLRQRFEERMEEVAMDVIAELRSEAQDDVMSDLLVDGTAHYGPRVRARAAQESEGVTTNAERNRRARRAAERLQREAMAHKTGK